MIHRSRKLFIQILCDVPTEKWVSHHGFTYGMDTVLHCIIFPILLCLEHGGRQKFSAISIKFSSSSTFHHYGCLAFNNTPGNKPLSHKGKSHCQYSSKASVKLPLQNPYTKSFPRKYKQHVHTMQLKARHECTHKLLVHWEISNSHSSVTIENQTHIRMILLKRNYLKHRILRFWHN